MDIRTLKAVQRLLRKKIEKEKKNRNCSWSVIVAFENLWIDLETLIEKQKKA